uniref:MICOS complex subunit MIC27-like n=1 Tax=Styela clava TaxID=7725 RepID=UPI001939C11E|nr:MICOS complex subunit MIC27-like [Styela clava]
MSSKPNYYYNLSIYGNEENLNPLQVSSTPRGWYFPLGIGEKIVSLFLSSKSSAKKLTTKGDHLLEYASSLEGTVKLGIIGSCACVGGVLSLILRPKGSIRKLFYPSALIATSSAICYPSTAYAVTKVTAVNVYNVSKATKDKIYQWQNARKQVDKLQREDLISVDKSISEVENHFDTAPVMIIPISDHLLEKETSSDIEVDIPKQPSTNSEEPQLGVTLPSTGESNSIMKIDDDDSTKKVTKESIQDMGQSSNEDSDLYTTRL